MDDGRAIRSERVDPGDLAVAGIVLHKELVRVAVQGQVAVVQVQRTERRRGVTGNQLAVGCQVFAADRTIAAERAGAAYEEAAAAALVRAEHQGAVADGGGGFFVS